MVELYIDSVACELDEGFAPSEKLFTLDACADVVQQRMGRKLSLALRSTPHNDALLLHPCDPCAAESFNSSYHHGQIKVDGVTMFSGIARLHSVESEGMATEGRCDKVRYHIELEQGGADWAEMAALTPISQTASDFEMELNGEGIIQSWSDESEVKFLPVKYDSYQDPAPDEGIFTPQSMMTVGDYHPFVAVAPLLERIFTAGGYTLESRFLSSEEAKKLHVSGSYAEVGGSVERLRSSSGFMAGRTSEATATANEMGRAWLTPLVVLSSLGNFVETTEGDDLYNSNGVLTIGDQGIEYHPKSKVTVGFEYYLKYTTDFTILSRHRLQGFDAIMLDDGTDIEFQIANPFIDKRDAPQPNVEYLCMVFDHKVGNEYRLLYYDGVDTKQWANFTTRTAQATLPLEAWESSCSLEYRMGGGPWQEYDGDWALYDGYTTTVGEIEVEVRVQTPPEVVNPSSGKKFTRAYLHGATAGQRITLAKECRLQPIFSRSPATGSLLHFADVMDYDATQLEFVEAVAHLYNLRIYTDCEARKVYVEPYDDFGLEECYDWSEYVDLSEGIEAEDLAFGQRKIQQLAYRSDAGGAVTRFNTQNGQSFGQWSFTSPSYAAAQGTKRFVNKLFCPTLSAEGVVAGAGSARLMLMGDRDGEEMTESAMRIVRYEGMKELPSGQRWGFPSYGSAYPFAAFHAPSEFTLCFEERDGAEGLHRHYDNEWQATATRRKLRLTLSLPPHLVASLPCGEEQSGVPTLRSLFVLAPSGQRATYRLMAVEGYDAATHKARCLFMRTQND